MTQAKKKQAIKTAKKQTRSTKSTQARRGQGSKCAHKTACDNRERNHIYIVTVLGMITAILLCANVAIMSV